MNPEPYTLLTGDARAVLATLAAERVRILGTRRVKQPPPGAMPLFQETTP